MELFQNIAPNFVEIFRIFWLFFSRGGWVLFVTGFLYMLWFLYKEETQHQFVSGIQWVFLEIKVPKENTTSTLAVEAIFAQMHALHRSLTFAETYVEGQFQQWYSLEIISMGGKVSFVIRTPKRYQHLVESAFYSQYPTAEIKEISDYMENFHYDVNDESHSHDFFGTEWKMTEDSVIPFKTYKEFEHPAAEEKVIDPLVNTIETLERIAPDEFLGLQILIQPIQNDEWEERAHNKIKELTGEEMPHKLSFIDFFLTPFTWFAKFSYREAFLKHAEHENSEKSKPRNNWLNMTEGEKQRVTLIENKINKACFNTKIRLLYIGPKERYDKIKRFELIGAIRHLSPGGGAGIHNTLKTDKRVWTKVDPLFSPGLERPYLEWETKRRKRLFLTGYKNRSIYIGSPKFLLSTEEIATLFHFPITTEGTLVPANVQTVESKKIRPPANLPIA